MKYGQQGNMTSISIEELKPRLAKIKSGSSGIIDVPDTTQSGQLGDLTKTKARLTILDATFSY